MEKEGGGVSTECCHHQLPVHFSIFIYIQLFFHCSVFHFRIKRRKNLSMSVLD